MKTCKVNAEIIDTVGAHCYKLRIKDDFRHGQGIYVTMKKENVTDIREERSNHFRDDTKMITAIPKERLRLKKRTLDCGTDYEDQHGHLWLLSELADIRKEVDWGEVKRNAIVAVWQEYSEPAGAEIKFYRGRADGGFQIAPWKTYDGKPEYYEYAMPLDQWLKEHGGQDE